MSTVDERVVDMQFNNQKFEKGVAQSTKSLEALKNALNFSDTERSMQSFQKTADRFSLESISDSLSVVSNRFSSLGIMGDQVLRTLTNKALQLAGALTQTVKSFTLGPITTGWENYAQQTSAVQRLISNGYGIEEAEKVVEKISWYADETSYSMTDILSYIGQATSSGIELHQAEEAVLGIANACGSAGTGAAMASHAMNGFIKAIASGKMTNNSWQWIHTASADSAELVNELVQAGIAAKTLKVVGDEVQTVKGNMVVNAATIGNTFSTGWATTEVMMSALTKYGRFTNELYQAHLDTGKEATQLLAEMGVNMDDISQKGFLMSQEAKTFGEVIEATRVAVASQWSRTFKEIFGNYEEAKVLWTQMSNELWKVFAGPVSDIADVFEEWHDMGGYEKFVETLWNTWEGIKNFITPIKEAMEEIVPPLTVERLTAITDKVNEASRKFKGLFQVLGRIPDKVYENGTVFESADTYLKRIANNKGVEKRLERLQGIIKIITSILAIAKNLIGAIWRTLKPLFSILSELGGKLLDAGVSLGNWLDTLRQTIEENDSFYKFFQKIIGFFQTLITASDGSRLSIGGFIDKLKNIKILEVILNGIASAREKIEAKGGIWSILGNAGSAVWNFVKDFASSVGDRFKAVWPQIVDAIRNLDFDKVLGLTGGIIGAKFVYDLFWTIRDAFASLGIFTGKLNLGTVFQQLTETLWMMQDRIEATTIRNLAISVAILAGSMLLVSAIPAEKLGSVVTALSFLTWEMVLAFKALQTASKIDLGKGGFFSKIGNLLTGGGAVLKETRQIYAFARLLTSFASAILLLAASMWILSKIDPTQMFYSFLVITAFLTEFVVISKNMTTKIVGAEAAAKLIKKLASAIIVLAVAVRILAVLDPTQLAAGVLAVGSLIFALGAFVNNVGPSLNKFGAKGLGSVISIAAAILILSVAAKSFAGMEWEELGKAGAAIGGLLLALGLFIRFATGEYNPSAAAGSVLVISAAMLIMAHVVKSLSDLSWEQLGKGMAVVVVSLAAFAGAVALMKAALGDKGGGSAVVAILALALAMQMITPVFLAFSVIPWESIFKPIAALAAILVIFGVAAALLQNILIPMAGLAGILVLVGLGMTLVAVGIGIFNAAFTSMAVTAAVNVASIIAAIQTLIYGIDNVLPQIIGLLGHLVAALIKGIGEMVVPIGIAIVDLIVRLLAVIGSLIGKIATQLVIFVIQCVNALAEAIRTAGKEGLLAAIMNLISSILELVVRLLADLLRAIPGVGKKIGDALDKAADEMEKSTKDAWNINVTAETGEAEAALDSIAEDAVKQGEEAGTAYGEAFSESAGDTIVRQAPVQRGMLQNSRQPNKLGGSTVSHTSTSFTGTGRLGDAAGSMRDTVSERQSQERWQILQDILETTDDINEAGRNSGEAYNRGVIEGLESSSAGVEEHLDFSTQTIPEYEEAGTSAGDFYATGFASGATETNGGVYELLESLGSMTPEYTSAGEDAMTAYSEGITSDLTVPVESGAELGAAGVYGVQQQEPDMRKAGVNFVLGFANGMNSLRGTLYQVAYNIGYQALTAAKTAILMNSPSKAMMEVGIGFDEGFIIGIESMSDHVYDAGYDLGDTALASMNNVLHELSDRLNNEMETDPIITPVLDMSNIRAGITEMDSLFANRPWMTPNVGTIVTPVQARTQAMESVNNQNGSPTTVNINVTTQELSNSTVDYLVRRVNKVLGGKV